MKEIKEKSIFTEKGVVIGKKNNGDYIIKILPEKGKIINVSGERDVIILF